MKLISFGLFYEFGGFNLYISFFYFPLIFALSENIFRLHDRISDLLGIRYRFDKNVIIGNFLEKLNLVEKVTKVNKENRDSIMYAVFYKYASSTEPKIDRHLIDMALSTWSWYWIFMDTVICVCTFGIIWLAYAFSWKACLVLLGIITFCLFIMYIIKYYLCRKYAIHEVQAILELKNSTKEIKRYLKNAL